MLRTMELGPSLPMMLASPPRVPEEMLVLPDAAEAVSRNLLRMLLEEALGPVRSHRGTLG